MLIQFRQNDVRIRPDPDSQNRRTLFVTLSYRIDYSVPDNLNQSVLRCESGIRDPGSGAFWPPNPGSGISFFPSPGSNEELSKKIKTTLAIGSNLFFSWFKNLNNLQFCEIYVNLLLGLVKLKLEGFLFYSLNHWWIVVCWIWDKGSQHWFQCLLSAKRIIWGEAKLSCNDRRTSRISTLI